jgi:DNA repair ATPase RecN
MSEPPRFNGLAPARAHLRLVAAVGILASMAIATGALASLFTSAPAEPEPTTGRALGLVTEMAATSDAMIELELRVREAELAAARARAALRNARQQDRDPRDLESFERRLEQLGSSPLESLRRGYAGSPADAALEEKPTNEGEKPGENDKRRAHLRAIAPSSREL